MVFYVRFGPEVKATLRHTEDVDLTSPTAVLFLFLSEVTRRKIKFADV